MTIDEHGRNGRWLLEAWSIQSERLKGRTRKFTATPGRSSGPGRAGAIHTHRPGTDHGLNHGHDDDSMLLINAVAPLLLISPYNPQVSQSCLSQYYYGTHGQNNVFITDDDVCVSEASSQLTSGAIVALTEDVEQLVWLQHQAVDDSIKHATFVDEFDAFFAGISTPAPVAHDQVVLERKQSAKLLYRTATSALVSVDSESALTLDLHLPPFWKASPLPSTPVPFIPVPSKAVRRVKDLLDNLKFDPDVAAIVNSISVAYLRADLRYLTGEAPMSEIVSRHSFSQGVLIAANWLKTGFEDYGANCTLKPFLDGFAPNVIWYVLNVLSTRPPL